MFIYISFLYRYFLNAKYTFQNVTEETYDVTLKPEESCLVVKSKTEPAIECFVTLTSVLMRELIGEGGTFFLRATLSFCSFLIFFYFSARPLVRHD